MTELRSLAQSIAVEAAELAARRRREGVRVAASKSSITDVVTEADREVEQLVVGRILDARPDDGVLGEEGARVEGTSGVTWVVDPIDGTVNYLYDLPGSAVSVAVVEGEPDPLSWTALAGCVVDLTCQRVVSAARGEGAERDGSRIAVAAPTPLEQMLVATGFAYDAERRGAQGAVAAALLPRVRDIRRMGVASMDLVHVATGALDASYERGLRPWDHAAGALIATEAGAEVRVAAGDDEHLLLVAGHPETVDALWPLLLELGAHKA